ncbi:hypothetical protein V8G54_028870 [Vigna mungo]|uniref:Retrotransposon Copia-like N-terminal domain-containing protein n=1 Tax=Vigna mungo TaxID=3915 RepID=A0AAQ3MU53_VIGMU
MAEESFLHNYLYFHPGENQAVTLVSSVLDDTNYYSWSCSTLTTFSAKNKIEFVLGNVRPPDKDKLEHVAWNRRNNMVVSWIVHFVSMFMKQSIMDKQRLGNLERPKEQIFSRKPLSPDSYEAKEARRSLITKVFSLVAQQERQLSSGNLIATVKTQDTVIATACTASASSTVCDYCGKYGHNEVVCYRKNDFPNQDKGFKGTSTGHKLYNKHAHIHHTSGQEENVNVKDNNTDGANDIRLTPQQF